MIYEFPTIKVKKFNIHIRRQGNDYYSKTNWGNDDKEITLSRAKNIMEVIERDQVGPAAKYLGQFRFSGIKIVDENGNEIYCEER